MKTKKQFNQHAKNEFSKKFNLLQPTIFDDEWNDEVFKNHNKTYGAYQLRHQYHQQLSKAFFISVSTLTLFFLLTIVVKNKDHQLLNNILPNVFIEPEIFDFPPLDKQKPKPQLCSKPVVNAPIIISKDSTLKIQPEIKQPIFKGTQGIGSDTASGNFNGKGSGKQEGSDTKTGKSEFKKDSALLWVPEMPEFPGGLDALNKFISKRTKTNNQWRESGYDGKVVYEFVVGRDGKIRGIKIIRDGVNYGIAELNLSIFENMPEWKPGKNNGNTVSVLYHLPIKFVKE